MKPAPVANPRGRVRTRGNQRRGIWTQGGSTSSKQKRGIDKATKEAELELKWKHEDSKPIMPPFTGTPGLKVDLPVEPNIIDFVSLFLTDGFFQLISNQANLYAEQYIASHPDERRYSCSHLWVPTSPADIKKFYLYIYWQGLYRNLHCCSIGQLILSYKLQFSIISCPEIAFRWFFNLFILLTIAFMTPKTPTEIVYIRCTQLSSSWLINLDLFMYLLSLYLLMKSSCFAKVS